MCQENDNDVHLSYGFDNFPQANSIFNFSWSMDEIQSYHWTNYPRDYDKDPGDLLLAPFQMC